MEAYYAHYNLWVNGVVAKNPTCLNGVQRLRSLCIMGTMRTTPTSSMKVLLNLTPLHTSMQKDAKYCYIQTDIESTPITQINEGNTTEAD